MPEVQIQESLSTGPATIDVNGTVKRRSRREKKNGDVTVVHGGGSLNFAEAYQAAGGKVIVCPITGADELGNFLVQMLTAVFVKIRRIATATRTRVSIVAKGLTGDGATTTITARHPLDHDATLQHLQPLLKVGRRLVLASMTAVDSPLIRRLIDANPSETGMLLTDSQCEDPESTLDLMRSCRFVQLNAGELVTLTGLADDGTGRPGISRLHERGIESVIATLGANGVTAYIDRQWFHQPAFDVVDRNGTVKCGDIAFGTFLAAIDRGESISIALRASMAAAAMHRAGVPRTGWESIMSFAESAKPLPMSRPATVRDQDADREREQLRRLVPITLVLAVVLATTITILSL